MVTFTLDFPGSEPSHYAISVSSDGHSTYDSDGKLSPESDPDPFHLDFSVSPATQKNHIRPGRSREVFPGRDRFKETRTGLHRGQNSDLQGRSAECKRDLQLLAHCRGSAGHAVVSESLHHARIWPQVAVFPSLPEAGARRGAETDGRDGQREQPAGVGGGGAHFAADCDRLFRHQSGAGPGPEDGRAGWIRRRWTGKLRISRRAAFPGPGPIYGQRSGPKDVLMGQGVVSGGGTCRRGN